MTAIADSSIGGKTAINYRGVITNGHLLPSKKNVFILEQVISRLPKREFTEE